MVSRCHGGLRIEGLAGLAFRNRVIESVLLNLPVVLTHGVVLIKNLESLVFDAGYVWVLILIAFGMYAML